MLHNYYSYVGDSNIDYFRSFQKHAIILIRFRQGLTGGIWGTEKWKSPDLTENIGLFLEQKV